MVASDEYISADDDDIHDSPFIATAWHNAAATAEAVDMMAVEPTAAHVTRTVSPHSAARIKLESGEMATVRSLRTVLSRHPIGQRILHVGSEEQVRVLLADPAVVEAASQPPSKEVALELRDAFAHVFCSTTFADCGVSVQDRSTRRAIESLVASWDWDLRRVEENVERHVIRLAGAGLFEASDISFINFLLELPDCRQARRLSRGTLSLSLRPPCRLLTLLPRQHSRAWSPTDGLQLVPSIRRARRAQVIRDAPALTSKIHAVVETRDAARAAFEGLGWWGVPDPTVHGVVADVLRDGIESLEGAVAEAIERQGASLRRAAYNRRVRETVITKYQERFKRQRFMPIDAEAPSEGEGGAPLDLVVPQAGCSSNVQG